MTKVELGRIGVLAGGPSSEREISLKSGRSVYETLKMLGLDARLIEVNSEPEENIKSAEVDIAFIALHGGFGEDGTIQGILEKMKIPYTGSGPSSSGLALDKVASKEAFIKNGISVPKYIAIKKRISIDDLDVNFKLPLVIKPQKEGSSIGLSVVRERGDFDGALQSAFNYGATVIIEEFINGMELTVGILDDKPLPVIEIVPKEKVYDFGAKYLDAETEYIVPARIEEDKHKTAKDLGARAHKALGCRDFSRVDMKMDENGNIFVFEVNTIPGLTERSLLPKAAQAAGISFGELCVKLLKLALKRRRG